MASQSLYRKYRPQTFADVVGQEHIEQTLRNALAHNRVSHAYLFCGPRGTGKTTTARLLAKALLCEQAPTANPDGTCPSCLQIAEGNHPDVYELDAASRTGVDNVREEIIGRVVFSPTQGRYKVYIIDEVHMLSTAAFNALLKTLEEPPAHVVFVLCTTDPQKVPATIISRCQRFDFHRLTTAQIAQCLTQICEGEGFGYDPAAIDLIAQQARGGMRDAITSLEQVAVFGNGNVNFAAAENMFGEVDAVELSEIFGCIARRDVAGCFLWVDRLASTGIDVASVVRNMVAYARNLYVLRLTGDERVVVDVSIETLETLRAQVGDFESADRLASLLVTLGDLQTELRTAIDARLSLEVALTRMAHPVSDLTLEALAARISVLEGGRAAVPMAGAAPAPVPAAAPAQMAPMNAAPIPAPVPADMTAPAPTTARMPVPAEAAAAAPAATAPAAAPGDDAMHRPAPVRDSSNLAQVMGDPSSLRRIWENTIRAIEKKHPLVPGLIGGSIPHGDFKNRRLVIDLPGDAGFGIGILNGAEVKTDMQAVLKEMLGMEVGIEYVLGATAASVDPVGQAPAAPSGQQMPGGSPAQAAPSDVPPWEQAPAVRQGTPSNIAQQMPGGSPAQAAPSDVPPWEQAPAAPFGQDARAGRGAASDPTAPAAPMTDLGPGAGTSFEAAAPASQPVGTIPADNPAQPGPAFDEVPLAAYGDVAPTEFAMPAFAAGGQAPWEQPLTEPQPAAAEGEDEMTSLFRGVFGDHVKFDG